MPPETGYMPPSSAWTRARIRIATPPIPHEMIAAGPAAISAFWAPKSQPDPMMEPIEAHSRPMRPISRLRDVLRRPGAGVSVAADISGDLLRSRGNVRAGRSNAQFEGVR